MSSGILRNRKIIMVVGGSISSYRTPDIIRDMVREGASVQTILSQSGSGMIGAKALEWATGKAVISELSGHMEHISLFENSSNITALLICPATYNMIGAMANGIASTPSETVFANALGAGIDITVVPAMHLEMYENPILQNNISKLSQFGVKFVKPRIEDGKAKIMWSEEIIDTLARKNSNGKSILIISGHSTVKVDSVRSLINRSTGHTGVIFAREAFRSGYERVVYVGNAEERVPIYCEYYSCTETDDYYSKVVELLGNSEFDTIIIPAALSDFSYESQALKISSSSEVSLRLEPRQKLIEIIKKILKKTGAHTKVVGFKLNSRGTELKANDQITVVNNIEDNPFGIGEKKYVVLQNGKELLSGTFTKEDLAIRILEMVKKE